MGFFPHRLINELCLASFAMRGYNCPPSYIIGHDCSEVLTNDVKTKVDTGSTSTSAFLAFIGFAKFFEAIVNFTGAPLPVRLTR